MDCQNPESAEPGAENQATDTVATRSLVKPYSVTEIERTTVVDAVIITGVESRAPAANNAALRAKTLPTKHVPQAAVLHNAFATTPAKAESDDRSGFFEAKIDAKAKSDAKVQIGILAAAVTADTQVEKQRDSPTPTPESTSENVFAEGANSVTHDAVTPATDVNHNAKDAKGALDAKEEKDGVSCTWVLVRWFPVDTNQAFSWCIEIGIGQ